MTAIYTLNLYLMMSQAVPGELDMILVESEVLGREIEVHLWDPAPEIKNKPILYFTDGKKMMDNSMQTLQELATSSEIEPAYYVFVSSQDPHSGQDFRNEYFFCNSTYVDFFEKELIPTVEEKLDAIFSPFDRSLVGISFGGLNAAYFSVHSTQFQNFGLLSPVTYPCPNLGEQVAFSQREDIRIFISSGQNDAEQYVKQLTPLYQSKDYEVEELATEGGHDFTNWNAQLKDLLHFLIYP